LRADVLNPHGARLLTALARLPPLVAVFHSNGDVTKITAIKPGA